MKLPLTGNADADRLLEDDPLALLIGMLLDQHQGLGAVLTCTFAAQEAVIPGS